jgi:hypothetical protein
VPVCHLRPESPDQASSLSLVPPGTTARPAGKAWPHPNHDLSQALLHDSPATLPFEPVSRLSKSLWAPTASLVDALVPQGKPGSIICFLAQPTKTHGAGLATSHKAGWSVCSLWEAPWGLEGTNEEQEEGPATKVLPGLSNAPSTEQGTTGRALHPLGTAILVWETENKVLQRARGGGVEVEAQKDGAPSRCVKGFGARSGARTATAHKHRGSNPL